MVVLICERSGLRFMLELFMALKRVLEVRICHFGSLHVNNL